MTSHTPFLELAAAAIDFRLSPSERHDLEQHLEGCQACARSVAGIRGDAEAMGHLPQVVLPERRGLEILDAALHPADARHQLRLVLVATLLTLLALGSLAVGAELVRRTDEDRLVVVPVPTTSTAPDASEPSKTAVPGPSAAPGLPDGLIAYTGVESGQHVIRTVRPDGSAARTIAEGESPAWSPDGTMLAFQCPPDVVPAEPPASDICVANADGSNRRVVVTGAMKPSWSPDGTRLLFGRSVIDAGDTWVVNVDGSAVRSLGGGTGAWSPDGEWILLLGASGAEPDATILHPDGTGVRHLGMCQDAAWSLDSTKLACIELQGTEGTMRTISVIDGSEHVFSEDAKLARPTWLSDRRMVMTMTGTGGPAVEAGDHLYLVDFQTGDSSSLLDDTATVTSVAPGATWLAVTVGTNGTSNIRLVSIDGEERTLTSDGTSMDAMWQPSAATADSSPAPAASDPFSSLYFQPVRVGSDDVAWATTREGLYRTSDGGATWTKVEGPAANATVSVAPDAETLFLVTQEPGSAVWVTRDAGQSWAEVGFPLEDGSTMPALLFPSPEHGFARFGGGKQPGVRIYETTDGGRSWAGPVVRDGPEGGMAQGGMAAIPGYEKGVLWRSNGKADNEPFDNRLKYSVDGGATWQEGQFPTGSKSPKNDLKVVDGLWADGTGRVVLAMSLGDGPSST